ncbi:uncharacterized protein LOC107263006 [Cephus cinctus]|uniref:Uncharacterized protein LOC107263006 n=1 Tax=Cephus cinctus TaxID=211228 RepID=A0AAJ7R993_CEPCN|nr:uncharacterized protein LOC107263006 [Cephus cinctus]
MSCCCNAEYESEANNALEFAKITSSGFDQQRTIAYYPEEEEDVYQKFNDDEDSGNFLTVQKSLGDDRTRKDHDNFRHFANGPNTFRSYEDEPSPLENENDEDITDMVFVDGNEADLEACDDEDCLMERVWWLVKPPFIPSHTPVVSARRVQVVKERLSSMVKNLSTARDKLNEQVEMNMKHRPKVEGDQYARIGNIEQKLRQSCQKEITIPVAMCARNLSDLL